MPPAFAAICTLSWLALVAPQGDTDLRPGLRAEYRATALDLDARRACVRVDREVQFDWGDGVPDLRLPPGPFVARWAGSLFIEDDGVFTFAVELAGAVRIRVGGRVALAAEHNGLATARGEPLEFAYGYHPIEIEYRATAPRRRVAVFWSSPTFPLEPLSAGALFQPAGEPIPDAFERGHRLVRALRCAACHAIPGMPRPSPAPSLGAAGVALELDALLERLRSPRRAVAGSRMPELQLSESECADIAAYLAVAASESAPKLKLSAGPKSVRFGRELVLTRGCLACHALEGLGAAGVHAAPTLDGVGERRGPAALLAWLSPPRDASDRAVHRPELPLEDGERMDAVAFLSTLRRTNAKRAAPSRDQDAASRGEALVAARRCGACHDAPPDAAPPDLVAPLHGARAIAWERSCLAPADVSLPERPSFELGDGERKAIVAFVGGVHPYGSQTAFEEGRLLLDEKGCTACHARGESGGLTDVTAAVIAVHADWAGREGALRPPSLASAGDKFLDGALEEVISGRAPRRRPWLEVRMPRFHHGERELAALRAFLIGHDRVPQSLEPSPTARGTASERFVAGHRLVGAAGFSCVSCHVVGDYSPEAVGPNVRGPDLVGLGARVREAWFHRWVRDASRMAPGVEMPAIEVAFKGILDGDRDSQIAAVWEALNSADFVPPAHSATVRELHVAPGERARIVRDVFKRSPPYGEGWTPRALAVGFDNGQSMLFDLDVFAPIAWWQDGLARQFTQGKFWFWEPAGVPVLPELPRFHGIAIARSDGSLVFPQQVDQSTGRLERWRRLGRRVVAFDYRLRLDDSNPALRPGIASRRMVRVSESVRAVQAGVARRIAVHDDAGGATDVFQALVAFATSSSPVERDGAVLARGPSGEVSVRVVDAPRLARLDGELTPPGADVWSAPLVKRDGRFEIEIVYRIVGGARVLVAPATPAVPREVEIARLDVVPGFEAVRLPLTDALMPTAIDFERDGRVVLTSLPGDVVRLDDSDGDGVEDRATFVADHLSAPFGILVEDGLTDGGESVVVSHKPELVRLRDTDGDGLVDLSEVVATGWGFSHDYHDWSFGLVERDGAYHVLMGSDYQQKGRAAETTMLRGKALAISPDGEATVLARGLRFTVGLAANADGELFFTDNQGEGNVFNELNHLRTGHLYGVPSLDDPRADRAERGDPPAIQLPHPWTRSVNGIAFLLADGAFGPFEGHGIGCEYDNRKLIRFSLQRVGETYQGACYPFSREAAQGTGADDGLLGPICAAVRGDGTIYIGGMKDSGWGGGSNFGEVVRLRPGGALPLGIREVRAWSRGFDIDFTGDCDAERALDPESYTLSAYHRIWKGGYATPDSDRHRVAVTRVTRRDGDSNDGDSSDSDASGGSDADPVRGVRLEVEPLREGFVFEVHVGAIGPEGGALWPAVGYYTMNTRP